MSAIDKVTIRMYRQGLGDCFLLSFAGRGRNPFHLLIDCGVLSKSAEHTARMNEVAGDIERVTKGALDVLVATHEHWDHLSGFLQARDVFDRMTIGEIWMAWTENPRDGFARKVKEGQAAALKAIASAYDQLSRQPDDAFNGKQLAGHAEYLRAYDHFFNFYGADAAGASLSLNATAEAFDTLRKRKKTEKVYLAPGQNKVHAHPGLPGVRVYVLGPPKDMKALRKMNPSKKTPETYDLDYGLERGMSFADAFDPQSDRYSPFSQDHGQDDQQARHTYPFYFDPSNQWRTIDSDWLYSAGNLAIALDSAVNNTSLALAIEFEESGKVLLFPADAQVGNWLSWSAYSWTVDIDGKKETVNIDDLLARTVFYKVGHHGSHNATLKDEGLEKMTSEELIAMIPVDQKMARQRKWKMPFKPLLEALGEKTGERVILQDEDYPGKIGRSQKSRGGVTDLFYDVVIHNA